MLPELPIWISIAFGLITLLTVYLFYLASKRNKMILGLLILFMSIQAFPSISGFYLDTESIPPRFVLMILPSLFGIGFLFLTKRGKKFIQELDLGTLTLLHTIRTPVELILLGLFIHSTIPELMTFEGRNFDIIAGITAPFVYYLYFKKEVLSKKMVLIWNLLCLGLLMNIVVNAILSTPSVFQQFAFNQPNIAILHFPFVWLPSVVVPIVLFSHLVAVVKLR